MKIKINSDPFNINKRIKQLNKNYYVVYNLQTKKYEIHNSAYKNSYCITVPYNQLDYRTIKVLKESENPTKIFEEIEKHNKNLELKAQNNVLDRSSYQLKEIYDYSNSHIKNFDGNAYKNIWV